MWWVPPGRPERPRCTHCANSAQRRPKSALCSLLKLNPSHRSSTLHPGQQCVLPFAARFTVGHATATIVEFMLSVPAFDRSVTTRETMPAAISWRQSACIWPTPCEGTPSLWKRVFLDSFVLLTKSLNVASLPDPWTLCTSNDATEIRLLNGETVRRRS